MPAAGELESKGALAAAQEKVAAAQKQLAAAQVQLAAALVQLAAAQDSSAELQEKRMVLHISLVEDEEEEEQQQQEEQHQQEEQQEEEASDPAPNTTKRAPGRKRSRATNKAMENDTCLREILDILSKVTVSDGQPLLAAFKQMFYISSAKKYRLTTCPGVAGKAASASESATLQRPAREVLSLLLKTLKKSKHWVGVSPAVKAAVESLHNTLQ